MSNGYAIIANEATYDTAPASGWREVGISGDAHQSRQDVITPNLIRRNASAPVYETPSYQRNLLGLFSGSQVVDILFQSFRQAFGQLSILLQCLVD